MTLEASPEAVVSASAGAAATSFGVSVIDVSEVEDAFVVGSDSLVEQETMASARMVAAMESFMSQRVVRFRV